MKVSWSTIAMVSIFLGTIILSSCLDAFCSELHNNLLGTKHRLSSCSIFFFCGTFLVTATILPRVGRGTFLAAVPVNSFVSILPRCQTILPKTRFSRVPGGAADSWRFPCVISCDSFLIPDSSFRPDLARFGFARRESSYPCPPPSKGMTVRAIATAAM